MDLAFRPEELPPWLLRTELPTLVRERCESAQQISVWLAVRWLLGAERKRPIGSREIAERAKVDKKSVPKYTRDLERLGLLEIVGFEPIRNLQHDRPIYRIPRSIEEENAAYTLHFVTHEIHDAPQPPNPDQLALPLGDALHGGVSDPKTDQTSDPKTDQRTGRSDPKTDQTSDPKTDHGREGGRDSWVGGSRARARKAKTSSTPLALPPTPPDEPPLPAHPIDLWRDACPNARPIDPHQLAALAAEHDATTSGYGLYYVGSAILKASTNEDVRSLLKIKKILSRWRTEASYGSDLYTEATNGRPSRPDDRARPRPAADTSRAGGDRTKGSERGPLRTKLEY